jgi:hypothetical protein|tara:strand:+ start:790 stop:1587 length:798 start_codon:yes stop_codon:yes gene_type:complete
MSVIKNKDKHGNLIEFRPADNKYRYKVNGEVKPGVTGLIGKRFAGGGLMWWAEHCVYTAIEQIMKKDKKPIDETQQFRSKVESRVKEIMAEARDIGTNMHKMAEDYINKKEIIQPSTEPLKTMFDKFTKWWAKKGFEVIATETTCYSQELDVCGTFDAIVTHKAWKGKYALLDFKTSKDFFIDQPIQISTYKKLIEDSTNLKIEYLAIVKIPKDPKEEIQMRMFELKPRYLKAFKACQFLAKVELDFAKRQREYNKKIKEKKNVN